MMLFGSGECGEVLTVFWPRAGNHNEGITRPRKTKESASVSVCLKTTHSVKGIISCIQSR